MLRAAGLVFETRASGVDERGVAQDTDDPTLIASRLAEAKALAVSRREPAAWVIGADQTLARAGTLFHKPVDRQAAALQLRQLAGHVHTLHSAVAVARGGAVTWTHAASVAMHMRRLADAEIDRYLDRAGDAALSSVGAYQVESLGIQLFERIEGDWFAILGLPLLPLLAYLRAQGAAGL